MVAMAALCLATPALAADLLEPNRVAVQPPVLQAPGVVPLMWSGPYLGIHAGLGVADWESNLSFVSIDCLPCRQGELQSATFGGPNRSSTAALAGVQGGYNWQSGALVVGLEADWSLTGLRDRTVTTIPAAALAGAGLGAITGTVDGFAGLFKSEIDWIATARGRIGVASGSFLFYGTGGLAFADASTRVGFLSFVPGRSPDPIPVLSSDSEVRVGWTLGAGVEAALAGNLSAKLEYLYADLGRDRRSLGNYIDVPASLVQSVSLDEKIAIHTVKLGLNYRFAGP
jgi:outer membrane immunogenic protein